MRRKRTIRASSGYDGNEELRDRAARVLGWLPSEVRSMSFHALREAVRTKDPELAEDFSRAIRSGTVLLGKSQKARKVVSLSQDATLRAMGFTDAQIANFKRG